MIVHQPNRALPNNSIQPNDMAIHNLKLNLYIAAIPIYAYIICNYIHVCPPMSVTYITDYMLWLYLKLHSLTFLNHSDGTFFPHPSLVSGVPDAELVDIRRMLHQQLHARGRRADAQQGVPQAVGRIGICTSLALLTKLLRGMIPTSLKIYLVGGTPLKNRNVSWDDDDSQYMGK